MYEVTQNDQTVSRRMFSTGLLALATAGAGAEAAGPQTKPAASAAPHSNESLAFINTGFENASPIQWHIDPDGAVQIFLLYDYERSSTNRAAGHWHFELQGRAGSDLTLVLHNFDNVYNGRVASPVSDKSRCVISPDGKKWESVACEWLSGNRLRLRARLDGPSLFIARAEPYRISDLDRLLEEIRNNPLVAIEPIGKTVAGRALEIVRVGKPDAPRRILLRGRAHAWEPVGNWVLQGLIRSLLADEELSRRCLAQFCLYALPMANKDSVAAGRTRFNLLGKDLNRDWSKPADPKLAPENDALEGWLKRMIAQGKPPDFSMDLHNDEHGSLHVPNPPVPWLDKHLARMRTFEQLLRKHTWFTVGPTLGNGQVNTIEEGLVARYGLEACLLEFNCNWIEGLSRPASAELWEQFGQNLRKVFLDYFAQVGPGGEATR